MAPETPDRHGTPDGAGSSASARNTDRPLGFLLHDVTRLMRQHFNHKAQGLGLTQAQYRVLLHLSRCEGIQQVGLAERLDVQPMTLARLLDKLQQGGLVERQRDPVDRRAFRLHLTAKAQPLLEQFWQLAVQTRSEVTRGISADELERFYRTLEKMKLNLGATA